MICPKLKLQNAILYDVDGFKNPNSVTKDLRDNGNIISLGGVEGGFCIPDGLCFTAPFKPTALTAADCNANKEKYGIQNCMTGDNDFWGGAMKTCAEQGKRLPNDSELTRLANDLYNTTVGGGNNEPFLGALDTEKASKYGIIYDDAFGFWSAQETDGNYAHLRGFTTVGTNWSSDGDRDLSYSYYWAVCVGD